MFEKIKERVLRFKWKVYHCLGDYCFKKVDEYGPERNGYWLRLVEKYTIKEFEIIDKLFKFEEESPEV